MPWTCQARGWRRCSWRRSGSRRRSRPPWPRRPPRPSRWSSSRSAAARPPGPWSPPTRAPWPARRAPTRPCSTPAGSPRWPPWTSWPTPASSWPAAGPTPAGWPPSTTPGASAPTCWTWPSGSGCRSPPSPRRPASAWPPSWSRASPHQPLDAWGTGNDADQIFATCIQALLGAPATAALALNLDLTTEPTPDTSYAGLAIAAAAATTKPVAVLSNLTSAADPTEAATLRAAGVPVLEGTATDLAALGHLFAYRDFLGRAEGVDNPVGAGAVDNPTPSSPGSATLPHRGTRQRRVAVPRARDRWRARLGEAGWALDEAEGLALLGDWGVPVVAAEVATGLEEAVAAAGRVGWPVALKTAAPGIAHKSDVGGVALALDGPERLAAAYADLAGRLGPRVLVAAMAGPGVELALGGGPRRPVRAAGDGGRRRGAGRGPRRPEICPSTGRPPVGARHARPPGRPWPAGRRPRRAPGRPGRGRRRGRAPLHPRRRPRPVAGRP